MAWSKVGWFRGRSERGGIAGRARSHVLFALCKAFVSKCWAALLEANERECLALGGCLRAANCECDAPTRFAF